MMVARATLAEIDPIRQSPHHAVAMFEQAVVPALREQDGYEGCYVLLSEEGKVLVLTFWESAEFAQASQLSGFYQAQIEKLSDFVFFSSAPGREGYEVVVADAPVTAQEGLV
jgi:heme-degrading monooxygenase HmoA